MAVKKVVVKEPAKVPDKAPTSPPVDADFVKAMEDRKKRQKTKDD